MLDELGHARAHHGEQAPRARCAPAASRSTAHAAGHHAVHHQPVAEAGVARAQHFLAQDAAMGVDEREGGVVADEAEVVDVVGDPLELGHAARAASARAAAADAERRLDGTGEGQA